MPIVICRIHECRWEEHKNICVYMMLGVLSIMQCVLYMFICITFDATGLRLYLLLARAL
jgi:hypothetical protein